VGSEAKPKVIARVLARLSVQQFPAKDYVEDYLRHLHRRDLKFTTLSSKLTALQLFLSFTEDLGKRHIEQITRGDLEAFVEHEQDRGLSIVSVKTRLSAVYALQDGIRIEVLYSCGRHPVYLSLNYTNYQTVNVRRLYCISELSMRPSTSSVLLCR
jgi:hypothetical protein